LKLAGWKLLYNNIIHRILSATVQILNKR